MGSTAVPGLASKPIVDILAPVTSLVGADAAVAPLEEDGWCHWPSEPNRSWRFWFADDSLRKRCGALKRNLAKECHDDREAYTNAKARFVEDALRPLG